MKTLQKLSNSTITHQINNTIIKQVVSDIVDQPMSEWACNRVIYNTNPTTSKFDFYKQHKKNFGMALYVEACKKYKIQATDYIGQLLNQVTIDRWLDRSHIFSHNIRYRDEYYRPMMYKLNELNK